jgi:hypothetical protein
MAASTDVYMLDLFCRTPVLQISSRGATYASCTISLV